MNEDKFTTSEQAAADYERRRAGYSRREEHFGLEEWEIPSVSEL